MTASSTRTENYLIAETKSSDSYLTNVDDTDSFLLSFKKRLFKALYTINQVFTLPPFLETLFVYIQYSQFALAGPAMLDNEDYWDFYWLNKGVSQFAKAVVDPVSFLSGSKGVYLFFQTLVVVLILCCAVVIVAVAYSHSVVFNYYFLFAVKLASNVLGSFLLIPCISICFIHCRRFIDERFCL
eukprot:TRINITY_DN11778_c0_g2_i2.p1 TRINITY_DN11778_c0_g2~~TRINITY_DN11778_c0_g2_i2.p1  ORF type:complete len:184 (+),score=28.44 TRINITY_DN11778_c0_g2_i2:155-706(+)